MYKEGWCVGLGQEGVVWWWVGTVWNTLKAGGTEKRGGEGNKDFKKGGRGQARSKGRCLKKGGTGTHIHGLSVYVKGCVCYIFANLFCISKRGTCETRKNVFYFTSKALFVLEIIKF